MRRPVYLILIVALCLVFAASMAPKPKVAQAQTTATEVTHVVQPGENLFRISLRYGVTVQAVASANGIANPNIIYVGQSLRIPGGTNSGQTGGQPGGQPPGGSTGGTTTTTYTVVAGDSLSKIARQFNTTVQAIAQANNIANVNLIFVGQRLTVPGTSGGSTGGTVTPTATGSATSIPGSTVDMGPFELGGHVLNFSNITQMQQASMKWAKVQIRYTAGTNPDVTAPAINEAHLNGLKILLGIVGDKNEMASKGFDAYSTEFATFVEGVARLGPEAIEVWNEPNLDREWPNGQISPATYTTLLRKSYEAIKRINPAIMVISGAPAPTGFFGGCTAAGCDDAPFVAGMRAAGAANYMDCIGVHYNEGILSPTARSGDPRGNGGHYTRYYYGMLDTYFQAFGGAKKVCFTELGYATPEGFTQSAPAGFEWIANTSLQEQALWLGEAAQLSRSSGSVRMMIVWNVNFKDASPDPSGMYAIVRPDASCPACTTLGQAMR